MKNIRPLHTEKDYDWALREVARYFDDQPKPGSPEGDRFEVLSTLIKEYEDKHHAIPDADPIKVIEFVMQQRGFSQADLAEILGSRPRASEILSRKRKLTLEMIRQISRQWKIPLESLSDAYALAREFA